jgi:hypothetical protein
LVCAVSTHVLSSAHHLVDEEELLSEHGSDVQELTLHNIVVPHGGDGGGEGLSSVDINTEGFVILEVSFLNLKNGLLGIETRVLGKDAGHNEEGISESLDSELYLSGDLLAGVLVEVLRAGNLESTGTGKNGLVLNGVLDSAETVTDGVTGLGNGVVVGALHEDGAGEGVLDALNESVFVFTEGLLVEHLGETHVFNAHVVEGVEELSTAGEGNALSIALLGAADSDDAGAGEDLKGGGVNALLVDNDEVLVGTVADLLLEFNNLVHSVVGESALRGNKLLTLVSVGPEEARVDLGLLVFEGDVEAHNVAVLHAGGHVRLATSVVEDETAHELAFVGHLVLHVHELNHVEIDLVIAGNAVDSINDDLGEGVSESGGNLGVEGGAGNFEEEVAVDLLLKLEGLKELEGLRLGKLKSINHNARVHSFPEVALSLAHELSNEEDVGGGAISDDVVLSSGSATNHGGGGVLDLHFVEEDAAILGQLNLSRATNKPKMRVSISGKFLRKRRETCICLAFFALTS